MQGKADENPPAKEEKSKDELWETCVSLQEELNRAVKEKGQFENERSSLTTSWNTSKQRLEASKARMREKLRVNQEVQRQRLKEIEERQQNLEELKTAQQEEICELKMAAKNQRKKGRSEVESQEKKCSLQVERAEQQVSSNILIRKLELKHQDKIKELYVRHEDRVKAVDERYETWVKVKKDEQSQENQTRLDKIDEEMRVKRNRVLEEQDCDWTGLDFERKRLKNNDREDSKALRSKLYDLKERDKLVERETAVALRQSERLKESLQVEEPELSESCRLLNHKRRATAQRLKRSKATCTRILSESHDLDVKNIQLELKIEQAENENDRLQRKHTEALLDIQQKNGMKHLLLERKIQTQTETQERLKIRLWVVQAVVQKDQTALKNIKELFQSKEATIAALKDDMPPESKEPVDLGLSLNKWLPLGTNTKPTKKASEDKQGSESLMQSLTTLCISDNDPVRRDVVKQNSVSAGPVLLRLSEAAAWP
ncbi:dynein regulatory complex subunit 4-like [Trematomus bernacchii]|uniref:dynein regulatory complex subunit 4-like n=1 Tax=Trematomus bernacchii TaxID=40690 RepID=UPI001469CFFD|nr:dynein regulatory complex subunit 4-like [Trematomus bernacchii]